MSRTIRNKYDVVVVGAGPAGVSAAAAAAECAGRVLLIDAANRVGGAVTAAMHRSMCGLYSQEPRIACDTLNGGAQRWIVEQMTRIAPSLVLPRRFGKAWVLEFPAATWETAILQMCASEKIDLQMDTRVTALRREDTRVTAIQIGKWIDVGAIIDCTGGGNILALAGDDTFLAEPEEDMLAGFGVRLTGLSSNTEMLRLQVPYVLAQAAEKNALPTLARFTTFYPGPGDGEGVCKLAIDAEEMDARAAEDFANQVVEHLKHECAPFATARIVEMSPRILSREGRRLRGKYVVTSEDVLQARKHQTDAVHAWWPIEKWDPSRGPTYEYPPAGEHYDIPPDAMRSAVIENLFAAGTCVSATPAAAASIRASGICLATGDRAGRLAAAQFTR